MSQRVSYVDDLFTYSVNPGNIATSGVANTSLQIQADADFVWVKGTRYAILSTGTAPFVNSWLSEITVLITDGASGRQLMNQALFIDNLFGTGELPLILPQPRIFKANSTVNFSFVNKSSSNQYNNVTLALIGYKKFAYNPGT